MDIIESYIEFLFTIVHAKLHVLLEKIRDIRSFEEVPWRKILDICATRVDYDAKILLCCDLWIWIGI